MSYGLDLLEHDLCRVIGRRNWNDLKRIVGSGCCCVNDGFADFEGLPVHYQLMVLDFMEEHPFSRLAKSYVGDGMVFVLR